MGENGRGHWAAEQPFVPTEEEMPRQVDKTGKRHEAGIPMPHAGKAGLNGSPSKAYVQVGQAFLQDALALNQEMIRLAGQRLQTDIASLRILPQRANWQDIPGNHSDFALSVPEACQAEIFQLMEPSTEAITSMSKSFYESAKALSDRAPRELPSLERWSPRLFRRIT